MPAPTRRTAVVRSVRFAVDRHRRLLCSGVLAAAVAAALQTVAPPPPTTTRIWAAVRDLPTGHRLTPEDLVATRWPGPAPSGMVTPDAATGSVLVSPLRRGEPLTDVRLVGPALLLGQPPGTVAVPVRPADPAVPALLRPGHRVDVVAGGPVLQQLTDQPIPPAGTVLAQDAPVLAVPGNPAANATDWMAGTGSGGSTSGGGGSSWSGSGWSGSGWSGSSWSGSDAGGVLLLALPVETAHTIVAAESQISLGVTLRPPNF